MEIVLPSFRYSAIDRARRAAGGLLDAPTRGEAIRVLAARSLFVTDIVEESATPGSRARAAGGDVELPAVLKRHVPLRVRAAMLRQLATAVEAGLPLLTAIRAIRDQSEHPAALALLSDLGDRVQAGQSLSEAMAAHRRNFTPLHISMARAGETAGVLEQVLASMADFAERELDIREKVRSAAMYPAIVLALTAGSILVILTFILPRILEAVTDATMVLPLPTRILLSLSTLLRGWGWLLLVGLIVGVWGFRRWLATPDGRLAFDAFKLRIPVLGQTLRKAAVARFARTLGTLSRSGIEILESLRVLRDTLGNEALAREVDGVAAAITQGQPIAEPLGATGQFPAMFIQVTALGERTGRLDEMLLRAADAYDRETAASIQRTMTVLPSIFIVVLSLVVAFILAAVLLPIVQMQAALPGM